MALHPLFQKILAPLAPPGTYDPAVDRKPMERLLRDVENFTDTGDGLGLAHNPTGPALGKALRLSLRREGIEPVTPETREEWNRGIADSEREETERFDEATGPWPTT